jgi:hypothetical protein
MGKCVRPRRHELVSMQLALLTHEAHGPPREAAGKKLERGDVNGRPVFPVSGVEMRRWVLGPVLGR